MTCDDDLPPEASGSRVLADAYRDAAPNLVAEYHRLKGRLEREGRWEYVGNVRDSNKYVISEFDSHGQQLLQEQRLILTQIDEVLVSKLRRGLLSAWAREGSPLGSWRLIPQSAWDTLELKDVRVGTAGGPGVNLFDIRIGKPVVPDSSPPAPPTPTPTPTPTLAKTGAPGRPSSMYLILPEFKLRADAGRLEPQLQHEAAALRHWFQAEHPDLPAPTEKTIRDRIREDYRRRSKKSPKT